MDPSPCQGEVIFGVKVVNLFKIFFSTPRFRQIKYIVMMNKDASTKIVNFMTPGSGVLVLGNGHMTPGAGVLVLGDGHKSRTLNMNCFFKNILLYSEACIGQIRCIVMMTREGFYQNYNFMTLATRVLVLALGEG